MGTLLEPVRSLSKTRASAGLVSLLYLNLHHPDATDISLDSNVCAVPSVTRSIVRYQRRLGGVSATAAPLLLEHLHKDGEEDEVFLN